MATKPIKYRAPAGLGNSKLWRQITAAYELRPDELRVLEDACREAALVDQMVNAMKGKPLLAKGSMGQPVPHPLLGEIRQHRAQLAALMRQLKIPDETGEGTGHGATSAGARSSNARKAANARWSTRGT